MDFCVTFSSAQSNLACVDGGPPSKENAACTSPTNQYKQNNEPGYQSQMVHLFCLLTIFGVLGYLLCFVSRSMNFGTGVLFYYLFI